MNKNRFDATESRKDNVKVMIAKDYSQPSGAFYSIGSEATEPAEEKGIKPAGEIIIEVKKNDTSQPETAGINVNLFLTAVADTMCIRIERKMRTDIMADSQKTMESLTPEQQLAVRTAFEEMGRLDREQKYERFRHLNRFVRPHQILFVGSSLMEQFPIYELLLDRQLPWTIYNRGVGGSTSFDLMAHMDECIFELQPDDIYINIGTNDMNMPDYTEEDLIGRYRRIIQEIRLRLPEARLFLLAYYPVNPAAAENNPPMKEALRVRSNARIRSANEAVRKLAEETGARFLNLNGGITDENGCLKAEYTVEGMHMYGDGYVPVLEALLPWLPETNRADAERTE